MVEFTGTVDRITEKGHLIIGPLATTASSGGLFGGSGAPSIELTLANLGQRPAAFGSLYSRYKIRQIDFTYIPTTGSATAGAIALGLIDDEIEADNTATVSNFTAVTQCRTSLNTQVWQKAMMTYRPVDPRKWYYTDKVSTNGTTDRFATQVSLVGQANQANLNTNLNLGYLRLDYQIQFEGAIATTTDNLNTNINNHLLQVHDGSKGGIGTTSIRYFTLQDGKYVESAPM